MDGVDHALLFGHARLSTHKLECWQSSYGSGSCKPLLTRWARKFVTPLLILEHVGTVFGYSLDKTLDELRLGAILFLVAKEACPTTSTVDTDRLVRVYYGTPFWFGRQGTNRSIGNECVGAATRASGRSCCYEALYWKRVAYQPACSCYHGSSS